MTPARLITLLLAGIIFVIALGVLRSFVGPMVAAWRLGPKGQERPTGAVPGWGDAYDPGGDCTIKEEAQVLRIGVPGSLHDLSVEHAQVGAPRVLRPAEGDFVATVTVAGAIAPEGDRASPYAFPYNGAGLLVWLDRDNYVRLERAAILRQSNVFRYVNFELRQGAERAAGFAEGTPDGPMTLRLERRGSKVSASYRVEGRDWVRLSGELNLRGWGPSVLVGVDAVNTSTAPFAAELRDFRVGTKPD